MMLRVPGWGGPGRAWRGIMEGDCKVCKLDGGMPWVMVDGGRMGDG